MSPLLAGLVFGLVGSGHCALMCGPLAVLPAASYSRVGYHGGRLLTYLMLGLLAGSVGAGASMLGVSRVLSVVSGVLLIGLAVDRWRNRPHARPPLLGLTSLMARLARERTRHRTAASWLFGGLNGLLPCGLVYAAVVAAAGFGTVSDALVFLGAFGAGTVPLLAATGRAGPALAVRLRLNTRLAGTIALAIVGSLLIVRGAMAPHVHAEGPAAAPAAAPHAHAGHQH